MSPFWKTQKTASIAILLDASTLTPLPEDWEAMLTEVKRYYSFQFLSKVVSELREGRASPPEAVVCLGSCRRQILDSVLPRLLDQNIPVTLFLDPRVIGTNALPGWEEFQLLKDSLPPGQEAGDLFELSRSDINEFDKRWSEIRKKFSLPIEKLNPSFFSGTWGDLSRLNPEEVELGLSIEYWAHGRNESTLTTELEYLETQMSRKIKMGYLRFPTDGYQGIINRLSLEGLLVNQKGAIDSKTHPTQIPIWNLQKGP